MNKYLTDIKNTNGNKIVASDMILTTDFPTTAGSKMLEGYMSLVESEVISKLKNAGYELVAKTNVGEFSIDVLGESSYFGAFEKDGYLLGASADAVLQGEALISIDLDVNGAPRRASAQTNLTCLKPTYGTLSRYGTIPVACSGETVTITTKDSATCKQAYSICAGYDAKDGTSIPESTIQKARESITKDVKKVALLKSITESVCPEEKQIIDSVCTCLKNAGIVVDIIDDKEIALARPAWNVLMSAELCNNVSRYDGVKFGYRSPSFTNLDELYTNSRTEAFGSLLKKAILFGSETLSTENYMKVYDKALRMRRVIVDKFNELFNLYDLVLLPACSQSAYSASQIKEKQTFSYEENLYTAPASVTGLPAMVTGGVQFIAKAFAEEKLFAVAEIIEKEAN